MTLTSAMFHIQYHSQNTPGDVICEPTEEILPLKLLTRKSSVAISRLQVRAIIPDLRNIIRTNTLGEVDLLVTSHVPSMASSCVHGPLRYRPWRFTYNLIIQLRMVSSNLCFCIRV
jgi:hypothetical protein